MPEAERSTSISVCETGVDEAAVQPAASATSAHATAVCAVCITSCSLGVNMCDEAIRTETS